jgi:hypothetical protein
MMDAALDSTRGFERNDPRWHCRIEIAETIDEVLVLVRDYVATLDPEVLRHLPDACRTLRVKAEDDIEYWTFKLSQRPAGGDGGGIDADLLQEVFNHFLHASLRLSQIHKLAASATLSTHEH